MPSRSGSAAKRNVETRRSADLVQDTPSTTGSDSGSPASATRSRQSASRSSTTVVTDRRLAPDKQKKSQSKTQASNASNKHFAQHSGSRDVVGVHSSVNGEVMSNVDNNHAASSASSAPATPRDTLLPHNTIVVWLMKLSGFLLVLFFFGIPAFIKVYPAIMADVAFLNHVRWPPFIDLSQPDHFGLNFTRNFQLQTTDGVSVGAWHVLPQHLALQHGVKPVSSEQFVDFLQSGHPVILYLHGNAGTRAGWHRVQLYKTLASAGYHVITFDYRGYGDSSGYPSEEGLVEDAVAVFKWLRSHAGSAPIYLWGHSLGSAVATEAARQLCHDGIDFNGLVLEGPFNNFAEAAGNHPFSTLGHQCSHVISSSGLVISMSLGELTGKQTVHQFYKLETEVQPFRVMPWFSWVFIEALKLNNITFATDENIKGVTVPILIMHALDDGIVPYHLGRKLYEVAMRSSDDVHFITFDGGHGYGHKHLYKSPDLIPSVRKFMSDHGVGRELESSSL